MKLAIISHTQHYHNTDNVIVGWGPTIKEINHLLDIADTIYHIAPLHSEEAPKSSMPYCSDRIIHIPLKPSGGKGLQKLTVLFTAPYNIFKVLSILSKVDMVQFRAPTGMGIYMLPLLWLIASKKHWVKYAGNWKDENMPLGNKVQKFWLRHCSSLSTKITINGHWENEKSNVIPFENPCLDYEDRTYGEEIILNKNIDSKLDFCFVGALNEHKGVSKVIDAFKNISQDNKDKVNTVHFVGDGENKESYIEKAKELKCNVVFHGFLPKNEIIKIYKSSHFIILPSKSEGFPKVIGEAMNFGCIPIVSEVSCINQYIKDKGNGFLINPNSSERLTKIINNVLCLNDLEYQKAIDKNFKMADRFTYEYYNNRIKNEIIEFI